jgi:hypothetical protein
MAHVEKLVVPANITLIPLPPKCPELNPAFAKRSRFAVAQGVENIWAFMRDNWLSNRIFTSYQNILEHCCQAWNRLTDQPWRIMSIRMREWVNGF